MMNIYTLVKRFSDKTYTYIIPDQVRETKVGYFTSTFIRELKSYQINQIKRPKKQLRHSMMHKKNDAYDTSFCAH